MTPRQLEPSRIEVLQERQAECYRRMTPAQRGAIMSEMYEMGKGAIRMQLKRMHPEWTEEQIHQEVIRRLLGETAGFSRAD